MKACNSCGKCCVKYGGDGLSVAASEIEYWTVFRPAIADFVSNGEIWIDPQSGQRTPVCPWLRKSPDASRYFCDIYYDRPDDCKHYPVTVEEMIRDDCEMLEVRDLLHPEQAQQRLDKLMVASRPPLV